MTRKILPMLFALFTAVGPAAMPALVQPKPNILFIMGDDIGWMQPSVYHRGPYGRRHAQH